jgi:para-aminobenzoate synthetase component 1
MKTNICFLNSNNGKGKLAMGGKDMLLLDKANSIEEIDKFINERPNRFIFLCLSYDLKNTIESLASRNKDSTSFPDAVLWNPESVFDVSHGSLNLLQGQESEEQLQIAKDFISSSATDQANQHETIKVQFEPQISKDLYLKKVNGLKEHIQRGDIYEVNYCQEYIAQNIEKEHINDCYTNLNDITKAPFSSYFRFGDFEVFCGSPERFIKREAELLTAQPIKGTAKRGQNKKDDLLLINTLKNDPKERAENIMIVDLMRNDLSKIAAKGTVNVDELCEVYTYKTVHQMVSKVSCKLKEKQSFSDILKATFPMGSMTGAPKIRAMQLIEEFEDFKRGLYSGSIGYISPNGDFDLNVVIRTLVYNARLKTLSCGVGSAITIKSDAEKEYEECGIKVQKILDGISR